ncbi:IS4 family transposase, partial [Thiocystis violacea]|uniref:IS4 family transposase n=1 Tax=Thiocystis violacea TaxID=13725 RepID=UPI0019035566
MYDQLKQALFSPEWIERFRRSEKAFTRTRDLPFHRLVTFLLNLRKGRTEQELEGFFATLEEQPLASATPTVSAVCKARQRLSAESFPALNRQAIDTFRAGWAAPLWHGFRLFAVDGTTRRLPNSAALESYFGTQPSGPVLARASMLYDLGHELVVDLQLAAHGVSERELAMAHRAAARPGDLILYDRGYPAFWLMVRHSVLGVDFCRRLARERFSAAEPFWDSDADSTIITLIPSRDQARDCRNQGLPSAPIRVRLVRVRLPDGETEVLAPSILEEERLPARLFKALYHRRWGAEEGYKRQKRWLEIENLSGRRVLAVPQDVHAKILALNLASMVRGLA